MKIWSQFDEKSFGQNVSMKLVSAKTLRHSLQWHIAPCPEEKTSKV